MGRKSKEPEKPSSAWLGTYGDMITLMLCFFVMLYNPSEIDVTQMATITQSLQMQETESVTGGLSVDTLKLFEGVDVFTFIAGRGITEAEDPAAAAREFKDEIKRIWG